MSVTSTLRKLTQFYRKMNLLGKESAARNLLFLGTIFTGVILGISPNQIFAQNASQNNTQNNTFISMKQMRQTLFSDQKASPLEKFRDKLVGQNPQMGTQNQNQAQNMRSAQGFSALKNPPKFMQNGASNGSRISNPFRQPKNNYNQAQNPQKQSVQNYSTPQVSTAPKNFGQTSKNPYAKSNNAAYRAPSQTVQTPQTPQITQSLQTSAPSAASVLAQEKRMEYLTKGSTSREDAMEAAHQIPWNLLSPQAQQVSESLVKNHSFYRRLPLAGGYCNPEAYDFLLCHPEMVVGIWEGLGHTQLSLRPTGPEQYVLKETGGSTVNIQVLYHDNNKILFYGNGVYQGSLFATPLQGEALVIMQYRFTEDTSKNNEPVIVTRMDTFIRLNNAGADMISRFFAPAIGKVIDSNFVKTVDSVNEISKSMEINPEGLNQVVRAAASVDSETKNEMMAITDRVCSQAYLRARGEQVDYYLLPKMNLPQIATAQILSRKNQTIKVISPNQLSANQSSAYASSTPAQSVSSSPLSGFAAEEGLGNTLQSEETLYFFTSDQNEGETSTSSLRPGSVLPDDEMEAFTLTESVSSSTLNNKTEDFSLNKAENNSYTANMPSDVPNEEKDIQNNEEESDIFFPENPADLIRYHSAPQDVKNLQTTQSADKTDKKVTNSAVSSSQPKKTALKSDRSMATVSKKTAALPLMPAISAPTPPQTKAQPAIPTQMEDSDTQDLHLDTFFESDDSEMNPSANDAPELQDADSQDFFAAETSEEITLPQNDIIEAASLPENIEKDVNSNNSEFEWNSVPQKENQTSEQGQEFTFESEIAPQKTLEDSMESDAESDSSPQNIWKKPSFVN